MRYAVLLPLALAACGSKPTVTAENASVAEVAEKVRAAGGQAIFLSPGRWESTVAVDRITIPGMPAGLAESMKKTLAGKVSASCLTPEEAKRPAAEFFGGRDRKDCRYDHFTMGDGKLDAKLTCGTGGQVATVTMRGTYSPDTFRIAMTTETKGDAHAPVGGLNMAATIDSRRTGACTGKES